MYIEEYEKRGFPLNFLLKLLIVILIIIGFVLLLTNIFFPKFSFLGKNSNSISKSKYLNIVEGLSSQIFIDNLDRMKEAAIEYYAITDLPKNNESSSVMTLREMIDKKLIVALIDKNNKICDLDKSYVEVTNSDNKYILKVNLKDSEKEDHILVNLNDVILK